MVSDIPPFGQHFRYIRQTKDDRGNMVPSEAPLLHNQVKLVDPVDRQAHGALAGATLSPQVSTTLCKGNAGLDAVETGREGPSHGHEPVSNPDTEVAEKQDGDLGVFGH